MAESISDIKLRLKDAEQEDSLMGFISCYGSDGRSGVKALVKTAGKRLEALKAEKERTHKMYAYENEYQDHKFICGIDEVGRGPFAGPVVAAAVILPKDHEIYYLNDSKLLSETRRKELSELIKREAVCYAIGQVEAERIDEINILQATYEAMREAIKKLDKKPDILLNDAVTIPGVDIRQVPIIKGDAKSASIAAASIIAKVFRDELMVRYAEQYPEYNFASNKGYGSQEHRDAIARYGMCPIHRRSFIH
ncbi:MAG: ribonuclease HII [Lachnospiraceae bacterium]|nr:ribonuclease HII [Lachnospiraceae bacterium]MBO6137141.1 ribonuclease HII [Lachnospiraceae bacterium]